jgi:hypothetical protein
MPPALSTVHEILRRSGRIVPPPGAPPHAYKRFEKEAPNATIDLTANKSVSDVSEQVSAMSPD